MIDDGLAWLAGTLEPILKARGITADGVETLEAAREWLLDVQSELNNWDESEGDRGVVEAMLDNVFPGGFGGFIQWRAAENARAIKAENRRKREQAAIAGGLSGATEVL